MTRKEIYVYLTKVLGRQYHTGDLRTEQEATLVLEEVKKLNDQALTP